MNTGRSPDRGVAPATHSGGATPNKIVSFVLVILAATVNPWLPRRVREWLS